MGICLQAFSISVLAWRAPGPICFIISIAVWTDWYRTEQTS